MRADITILGRFPSMNEFIDANRISKGKWNKGNTLKQDTQEDIIGQLKSKFDGLKIDKPIYLYYEFYEPNKRRDMDNVSSFFIKCFQDSLVNAGIIKNDNWNFIEGFEVMFFVDKERPRVEVRICW